MQLRTRLSAPPQDLAARGTGERSPTSRAWGARAGTALILLGLLALAVMLRQPRYLLQHSFWLDESWVVDSIRAPLSQARLMTASTPLGWTLLLRIMPPFPSDPERYRLIPLAFGAASVLPAWWLGTRLGAGRLRAVTAALVALAAAAAPASLARHDLKQYTADALAVLTVAVLAARVEERWDRRRLAWLAAGCVLLVPFSHAAFFAAAAGLVTLAALAALARDRHRMGMLAIAALPIAAVGGAWYLLTVVPGANPYLHVDWAKAGHFVPLDQGPVAAVRFVGRKLAGLGDRAGFGSWPVALALAATGVTGFWLRGSRAAALYLPVLLTVVVGAATLELYPLFDERTGLFASVLLTTYAAAGVAAAALGALGWRPRPTREVEPGDRPEDRSGGHAPEQSPEQSRRRPGWLGTGARAVTAVAVVAGAAVLLVPAAASGAARRMPESGVRRQIEYVRAHQRPGDVIVVAQLAQFGFGYYWPDQPVFEPTEARTAVRFQVSYPRRADIVVLHQNDWPAMIEVLDKVAGSGARRAWIVIAHGGPRSWGRWRATAAAHGKVSGVPTRRGQALPYLLEIGSAP